MCQKAEIGIIMSICICLFLKKSAKGLSLKYMPNAWAGQTGIVGIEGGSRC